MGRIVEKTVSVNQPSFAVYAARTFHESPRPGPLSVGQKAEGRAGDRNFKLFLKRWARGTAAITAGLICAACLLFPAITDAHRVNVFAYVEGDSLVIEGYFSKSAKARNCDVHVLSAAGRTLASGTTDDKGIVSFPLTEMAPVTGRLTVVLETQDGHRAEYQVTREDIPKRFSKSPEAADGPRPAEVVAAASEPTGQPVQDAGASGSSSCLKNLDGLLATHIAPLEDRLTRLEKMIRVRQQEGPSLRDIVGGIGWIMGLVGVGAYFLSRRGNDS